MSEKMQISKKKLVSSVKVGAVGCILNIVMLLLPAWLIYSATIGPDGIEWIVLLCTTIACALAQKLHPRNYRGRGVVLHLLLSTLGFAFLLIILTAGIPGGTVNTGVLLITLACALLGNAAGAFIVFNKSYIRKNKKRR